MPLKGSQFWGARTFQNNEFGLLCSIAALTLLAALMEKPKLIGADQLTISPEINYHIGNKTMELNPLVLRFDRVFLTKLFGSLSANPGP